MVVHGAVLRSSGCVFVLASAVGLAPVSEL